MAAQALYRRWRPQSFDDVIGQEHVTRTLKNAVAGDRLAHAYLFTGVRGHGQDLGGPHPGQGGELHRQRRQALQRLLRSAFPSPQGRALDLIEIDAASNTGVDDVRDLRDKIGFAPNELTYKVYIVDEVHMLSTAAFNALLKTLEEPPPHAIFILATTEPHKMPDTIVSRCQRHDFRRVPRDVLVGKLAHICEVEGVTAEPDALSPHRPQRHGLLPRRREPAGPAAGQRRGGDAGAGARDAGHTHRRDRPGAGGGDGGR